MKHSRLPYSKFEAKLKIIFMLCSTFVHALFDICSCFVRHFKPAFAKTHTKSVPKTSKRGSCFGEGTAVTYYKAGTPYKSSEQTAFSISQFQLYNVYDANEILLWAIIL